MNEPSREAKQAAANWWLGCDRGIESIWAYALGYDAAMAKLRPIDFSDAGAKVRRTALPRNRERV